MDNSRKLDLVNKTLEGKHLISKAEFHSFVGDFIRSENDRGLKDTQCKLSKSTLDFGLNVPFPVVELNEQKWTTDQLTITNNSKNKVYVEVQSSPCNKYDLQILPSHIGEVGKKGGTMSINLNLRVFCTTKLYPIIKFTFYKDNILKTFKNEKNERLKRQMSFNNTKHANSIIGCLYMCFKIESELSASIDHDEITTGSPIGQGGFGTVYKAKWRDADVAVKVLNTQELVDDEREMVFREIKLMGKLNQQYIVTYMGATIVPGFPLCIVMEFVEGGSLTKLLQDPTMDDKFRCKLALDVAKGMAFLHSNNIFHRDLKPDNLLVVSPHRDTQVNLKITDFGTSRTSSNKNKNNSDYLSFTEVQKNDAPAVPHVQAGSKFTKGVGTLIYQAPELLEGKSDYAIEKTDIFSFGVLLWQIFTGKEPFSDKEHKTLDKFAIVNFVTSGKRLPIPDEVPSKIRDLIKRCWHHSPENRPSFANIAIQLEKIHVGMKNTVQMPSKPSDDNAPVPRVPAERLADVGWCGTIGRVEAEEKLSGSRHGTFLVRWSHNTQSYVLSYSTTGGKFQHIAYIRPSGKDESIRVDKQDGTVSHYANILEYIDAMKGSNIIKTPYFEHEDIYERSPSVKN